MSVGHTPEALPWHSPPPTHHTECIALRASQTHPESGWSVAPSTLWASWERRWVPPFSGAGLWSVTPTNTCAWGVHTQTDLFTGPGIQGISRGDRDHAPMQGSGCFSKCQGVEKGVSVVRGSLRPVLWAWWGHRHTAHVKSAGSDSKQPWGSLSPLAPGNALFWHNPDTHPLPSGLQPENPLQGNCQLVGPVCHNPFASRLSVYLRRAAEVLCLWPVQGLQAHPSLWGIWTPNLLPGVFPLTKVLHFLGWQINMQKCFNWKITILLFLDHFYWPEWIETLLSAFLGLIKRLGGQGCSLGKVQHLQGPKKAWNHLPTASSMAPSKLPQTSFSPQHLRLPELYMYSFACSWSVFTKKMSASWGQELCVINHCSCRCGRNVICICWMNEWMNAWVSELMDEWMNERMDDRSCPRRLQLCLLYSLLGLWTWATLASTFSTHVSVPGSSTPDMYLPLPGLRRALPPPAPRDIRHPPHMSHLYLFCIALVILQCYTY